MVLKNQKWGKRTGNSLKYCSLCLSKRATLESNPDLSLNLYKRWELFDNFEEASKQQRLEILTQRIENNKEQINNFLSNRSLKEQINVLRQKESKKRNKSKKKGRLYILGNERYCHERRRVKCDKYNKKIENQKKYSHKREYQKKPQSSKALAHQKIVNYRKYMAKSNNEILDKLLKREKHAFKGYTDYYTPKLHNILLFPRPIFIHKPVIPILGGITQKDLIKVNIPIPEAESEDGNISLLQVADRHTIKEEYDYSVASCYGGPASKSLASCWYGNPGYHFKRSLSPETRTLFCLKACEKRGRWCCCNGEYHKDHHKQKLFRSRKKAARRSFVDSATIVKYFQ